MKRVQATFVVLLSFGVLGFGSLNGDDSNKPNYPEKFNEAYAKQFQAVQEKAISLGVPPSVVMFVSSYFVHPLFTAMILLGLVAAFKNNDASLGQKIETAAMILGAPPTILAWLITTLSSGRAGNEASWTAIKGPILYWLLFGLGKGAKLHWDGALNISQDILKSYLPTLSKPSWLQLPSWK